MIILIDGYNLLKQIFFKVRGTLDRQRKQLVQQLGYYKSKKKDVIREIIVVFDAGPFRHAFREIHDGVTVVFSGQKSSADDWIVRYTEKHKEKEMLLVSQDRELVNKVEKRGVYSVEVYEFYNILQNSLLDDVAEELTSNTDIRKFDVDDDAYSSLQQSNSKALDLLMEQESMVIPEKDSDRPEVAEVLSQSKKKLSKKEKALYAKLKKLL